MTKIVNPVVAKRLQERGEVYALQDRLAKAEAEARRMSKALQAIADDYENPNLSHVDFRVRACQLAKDALQ
jgi:hypothetical protein